MNQNNNRLNADRDDGMAPLQASPRIGIKTDAPEEEKQTRIEEDEEEVEETVLRLDEPKSGAGKAPVAALGSIPIAFVEEDPATALFMRAILAGGMGDGRGCASVFAPAPPSLFAEATSPPPPPLPRFGVHEKEGRTELDSALGRWMETELGGPLRYNVVLSREIRDAQRHSDYLISENTLLRRRQQERQQLLMELNHQQDAALSAALDTIALQQRQLLEQQSAILRALKVFTVAFEVGGGRRGGANNNNNNTTGTNPHNHNNGGGRHHAYQPPQYVHAGHTRHGGVPHPTPLSFDNFVGTGAGI
jgi:hypothetical protein